MARRPPSRGSGQPDPVALSSSESASLLWAHQLKREHGFLLERMNRVESQHNAYHAQHNSYEARIKVAEATAESMKRELLIAIDEIDSERNEWTASTQVRIEKLSTEVESARKLPPRLSALETQVGELETEAASSHQVLVQKIWAVEAALQKTEVERQKVVKKSDSSDTTVLSHRLDAMEVRRKEDERKAAAMQDKMDMLERLCHSYNEKNKDLQARLNAVVTSQDHPLPTIERQPTELLLQVPTAPITKAKAVPKTKTATKRKAVTTNRKTVKKAKTR